MKSRSGATPREVRGDGQGVLVVDAYTGYNTVLGVNYGNSITKDLQYAALKKSFSQLITLQ
jgi:hypothetical protein